MKIFNRNKSTTRATDMPRRQLNLLTGAILITVFIMILSIIFTDSTISYYMTEFADWLVASGMWTVFLFFPVVYYVAYKHSDYHYFKRHKKFFIIWHGGVVGVLDYIEKKDHAMGRHHVLLEKYGWVKIPLGQLYEKDKCLFWCANPAIKHKDGDMWAIHSVKGHEMTVIEHLIEENVLEKEHSANVARTAKKYMDLAPNMIAAALDPERVKEYAGLPHRTPKDPYSTKGSKGGK